MVNKKRLSVYRKSVGGNYIATLAIGKEYLERWEKYSLPFWRIYCDTHGLGLVALIEPYLDPGKKRNDWQKFLVGLAIKDQGLYAERVCFVDYDIVPNPFASNIFNELEKTKIGFVSQRNGLPQGNVDDLLRNIVLHRHNSSGGRYPLDSYITRSPEDIFSDYALPKHKNYGCGGLFVFNLELHNEYFLDVFKKYDCNSLFVANPGEEVYLNHHIQSRDDFEWLPYQWHTLWWYEMAYYYPWLYDERNRNSGIVEEAIIATLLRSNFVHFVGSWEKWAWLHFGQIQHSKLISKLKEFREYQQAKLDSPSLGLIFPVDPDENKIISK
jgi:hypothetical protein